MIVVDSAIELLAAKFIAIIDLDLLQAVRVGPVAKVSYRPSNIYI